MRKSRGSTDPVASGDAQTAAEPAADAAQDAASVDPRSRGPWDAEEHPVDPDDQTRAHLGALSVSGRPDMELRLQVDQESGQVAAVMMVASDGAIELRPYAAPRNESLWDDVRAQLAEEVGRLGGQAREVDGPYGVALEAVVPATTPEGQKVAQHSKILGIEGPRWLLRVSLFGRPVVDFRPDGLLEQALRDVVVIRGGQPMSPGEPLPLLLPDRAQRLPAP
jgi:hypothetical protein